MSKKIKNYKKDIEILGNNISELKEEINRLEQMWTNLKEQENSKQNEQIITKKDVKYPEHWEKFYYLAYDGSIMIGRWYGSNDYYKEFWRLGNGFFTIEEADKARKRIHYGENLNYIENDYEEEKRKVIEEMKIYSSDFQKGIYNYFVTWCPYEKRIGSNVQRTMQENKLYFEDKDTIEAMLDDVGRDRVKKYYLGIEE